MKTFRSIAIDRARLSRELDDLEGFLTSSRNERDDIIPFFKARPDLSASLSLTHGAVEAPDRIAFELDLFGDFVCDVAAGDSEANAFSLIEFEDAKPFSILKRLQPGKAMKRWSPRFEHGFSQLVDWAWRLSEEGPASPAIGRVFGSGAPTIHLLLVIGRDADLAAQDLTRLRWRANHTSLGTYRMSCFTFDGVLQSVRRRLLLAAQQA